MCYLIAQNETSFWSFAFCHMKEHIRQSFEVDGSVDSLWVLLGGRIERFKVLESCL